MTPLKDDVVQQRPTSSRPAGGGVVVLVARGEDWGDQPHHTRDRRKHLPPMLADWVPSASYGGAEVEVELVHVDVQVVGLRPLIAGPFQVGELALVRLQHERGMSSLL